MPRTRPPYPPEFRTEAVRLVHESGRTMTEVARDLGVSTFCFSIEDMPIFQGFPVPWQPKMRVSC
jgi:hypothetical protein